MNFPKLVAIVEVWLVGTQSAAHILWRTTYLTLSFLKNNLPFIGYFLTWLAVISLHTMLSVTYTSAQASSLLPKNLLNTLGEKSTHLA